MKIENSKLYQILSRLAKESKGVVFSGLPGVGKSLYINTFQQIAEKEGREITIIQWDNARKSFETEEILEVFPINEGMVHNGVKLSAGLWLIEVVTNWLHTNTDEKALLLIEAPLVGHRFVELAKVQEDPILESFFCSDQFKFVVPIPSIEVREMIEAERGEQVSEEATNWHGAKPSVMLLLWKLICKIANEMGMDIPLTGQPPYDPKVYEFVFRQVLKHRHMIALHVDEVYETSITNEGDLHSIPGINATADHANYFASLIRKQFPLQEKMNELADVWYLT